MRLLKRISGLVFGLAMCLAMSSVVRADAVTDWNEIAIQTIAGVPSHPGATSLLDSAMVQAAVYDAVEAITGKFRPYHVHIPGASGLPEAAVAKAAHDILVSRFSSLPSLTASLDTTYHDYLATHNLAETDAGVSVRVAGDFGVSIATAASFAAAFAFVTIVLRYLGARWTTALLTGALLLARADGEVID